MPAGAKFHFRQNDRNLQVPGTRISGTWYQNEIATVLKYEE